MQNVKIMACLAVDKLRANNVYKFYLYDFEHFHFQHPQSIGPRQESEDCS